MEIIFALLPVALILAALAVGSFIWSVRKGQYDDLETPAMRILFDDEPARTDGGDSPQPSQQPRTSVSSDEQ